MICRHGENPYWCRACGDERLAAAEGSGGKMFRDGPSAFDGALGQPEGAALGAGQKRGAYAATGMGCGLGVGYAAAAVANGPGGAFVKASEPAPYALAEHHLKALEKAIENEGYRIFVEIGTDEVHLKHDRAQPPAYEESDWCVGCGAKPGQPHTPKYSSTRNTCEEYGYPGLFRGLEAEYGRGLKSLVGPSYEQLEIGLRKVLEVTQAGVAPPYARTVIEAICMQALGE